VFWNGFPQNARFREVKTRVPNENVFTTYQWKSQSYYNKPVFNFFKSQWIVPSNIFQMLYYWKKKYNEHISKIILLVMEQHSNNINIHKTIRCCYDCTIVVYSSGDTMSTSLATTQYRPALLRFHTGTSPHLKILHSVTSSTVTRFLVCKKRNRDTFFFGLIFRKRNVTVL